VLALIAALDHGGLRDALTVLLGLLTGMLSGAFGVGGAIISTPGLRALGVSAFGAVGTTLPPIIPGAAMGVARYARDGLIDWRVVATTAPAGLATAVLGSLASHAVPGGGHWLMVLTALLLGVTAVRIARSPGADAGPEGAEAPRPARPSLLVAGAVGGMAGLLSGLLGVGGGLVLVPGLSEVMGIPLKKAIATSLACVGIFALPSTVTHAVLGDIDWRLAALLAVAVVPGARIGASLAIAASTRRLQLVVGIVFAVIAVIYAVGEISSL